MCAKSKAKSAGKTAANSKPVVKKKSVSTKHVVKRTGRGHSANKYISETEKNLATQLSPARGAKPALLFDEADAIFGKRSEVKDSHDRYANMEPSYQAMPKIRSKKG